ncbi:glutamate 5-kinase [Caldicellulosiruptor hydrothermalis 108]|uniref:Glutamate 5-kinase n=1 Tax=Caldicellulosiruptor hydrothermalis (strain DSM 18901 / VKM B-2411 / 108) TaxID=632292 RepID=E4Q8I5_CALH1|nr:glutamate 5-kinase [Caldicellulosiruptor hydrothermalis]ADQ06830.1 glutamate 5-kinase [Caldicellulosiruptor hydrothermalis 108]
MRDFGNVKKVVVKVGTSTVTYPTGKLNLSRLEKLARVLSDIKNEGRDVVLVTSGAVASGLGRLGLTKNHKTTQEKQALAAIGQGILMQIYEKLFGEYGVVVAQVLLTKDVVDEEKKMLNVKNTFEYLFKYGAIPIVNENDVVAIEELEFGDNDTLSAYVATIIDADLLIILSDIDGLYSCDPRIDKSAELIKEVFEIDSYIESIAGGAGSVNSTGGMQTKIEAAKIAMQHGIPMVIANGENPTVVKEILEGKEIGTLFVSKNTVSR